jgi:hypothetical protein
MDSVGADAIAVQLAISALPPPRGGDRDQAIVAIAEDGLSSDVRRGENRGRTLAHAAVVRSLDVVSAGLPAPGDATITAPRIAVGRDWSRGRLTIVAFVQESRSRRIVAAASQALPPVR